MPVNKRDVCAEWPERLADVKAVTRNAAALSAHESIAPIVEVVRERTVVLLGSSGAGKSTIANAFLASRAKLPSLCGSPTRAAAIRRHAACELPGGGALIDTPGLRELALWAGQDSVDDVFADIAALARECRFHDCAHAGEPGCAVSAALKTGELEPARWASYQKLLAEARYHERSVDQREAVETKRKWKVIHKAMRHHPKYDR